MVESLLDDPRVSMSVLRCPRFKGCPCKICPLDPLMKERPVPDHPVLCYWYATANAHEGTDYIPEFLFRPLIDYLLYLLKIGVLTVGGARIAC